MTQNKTKIKITLQPVGGGDRAPTHYSLKKLVGAIGIRVNGGTITINDTPTAAQVVEMVDDPNIEVTIVARS